MTVRRLVYWLCFLLVTLPMLHQAADRMFNWNLALATSDLHTGLSIYNALLLQEGGLAPDYVLRHGFPVWLWGTVLAAGLTLVVRRLVLSVRRRSLEPPETFQGWLTLIAGVALGLWCFHVLASFNVPGFVHLSLIFWFLAKADTIVAISLMVWFWPTELMSIPWLRGMLRYAERERT